MEDDSFRIRLSKFLSYILRHDPGKCDLKLDPYGYARLEDVLSALRDRFHSFTNDELFQLVEEGPKKRFEIKDDKIRATYGHSVEVESPREPITPPETLYHGTSEAGADKILKEGLSPMARKYVHLSESEEDAHSVGARHTQDPVILKIAAAKAASQGIEFFKESSIYLTQHIPTTYIR